MSEKTNTGTYIKQGVAGLLLAIAAGGVGSVATNEVSPTVSAAEVESLRVQQHRNTEKLERFADTLSGVSANMKLVSRSQERQSKILDRLVRETANNSAAIQAANR